MHCRDGPTCAAGDVPCGAGQEQARRGLSNSFWPCGSSLVHLALHAQQYAHDMCLALQAHFSFALGGGDSVKLLLAGMMQHPACISPFTGTAGGAAPSRR